jgi:hypothetical protein
MMPPTVMELDQLFRSLQHARGRERVLACQRFCRAIISVQRRGELGMVPAASWIEAALQYPEFQADEGVVRLSALAGALQSPLGARAHDRAMHWRELVKRIEQWLP